MRNILAFLVLLVVVCSYTNPPKLKHVNRGIPLYLSATGLMDDSSDAMLDVLKVNMHKMRCSFITKIEFDLLNRQNEGVIAAKLSRNANFRMPVGQAVAASRNREMYIDQAPIQTLRIIYFSATEFAPDFTNCDSLGFAYTIFPVQAKEGIVKRMWHMDEIGSRQPDSVARFLLKEL